jgi:2-polyprenyl-6-methoxyphenol hydroxylase-like FAD-dependent oxidoreductase
MSEGLPATARVPLHVLIIGGGIAGLCLAQGLKQSGISVAIYERDSSARFKGQGYRIGIKQDGSRALRECLPEHLFDLAVATSIRSATRMVFLDHQLNQTFMKPLPGGERESSRFGVDRFTLRQVLLAGLEDIVRFGKTCQGFDQVEGGRVAPASPTAPRPPASCWWGPTGPARWSAVCWCPTPGSTTCTPPSTARPRSRPPP